MSFYENYGLIVVVLIFILPNNLTVLLTTVEIFRRAGQSLIYFHIRLQYHCSARLVNLPYKQEIYEL